MTERLDDLIDWELVLTAEHVYSSMRNLRQTEQWRNALPALLPDLQHLLCDALDLMASLGVRTTIRIARLGICRRSVLIGRIVSFTTG